MRHHPATNANDEADDFGNLSIRIAAAELAVIERDGRVRQGMHDALGLAREKAGTGLAIGAGVGGAWWLARQFFPQRQVAEKSGSVQGSMMPYALSLLGSLATRALLPAGGAGLAGGPLGALIGLALPKIGSFFAKDSKASQDGGAPMQSEGEPPVVVQRPAVRSVQAVDLRRYLGHWYEIARLPTSYESHCSSDVTATYALDETPGLVCVLNSCREPDEAAGDPAEGKIRSARGVAQVVKGSGNAQLKVCFAPAFLRALPFVWADYWILAVDDDYRFALVGTPDHRCLWLLSRTPQMPQPERDYLIALAGEQGFETEALIFTVQNG